MQGRALNNGTERPRCCRPLIERALSFKELSRADYPTTVRALAHQGQKTRTRQTREGDLEKGSSENYLGGEPRTRLVDVLDSYRKLQSLWEVRQKHILTKLVVLFSTNDNYYLTISSNPILSLKGFLWILTLSIF